MTIQINTDNHIKGGEKFSDPLREIIEAGLERYSDRITKVEAHLSDEDGNKNSENDIRCMLEARVAGRSPIAVTNRADTHVLAVEGAIDKLLSALESAMGKVASH